MSAHGTRSGYMAHRRNGTEACAPCKAAARIDGRIRHALDGAES